MRSVLLQDTVHAVEKLIELRKENWEVAPYPVEDHSYDREASWADEYKRTLKLFVENLRPEVRRTRRELISLTPCFEGEGGSMLLRAFIAAGASMAVKGAANRFLVRTVHRNPVETLDGLRSEGYHPDQSFLLPEILKMCRSTFGTYDNPSGRLPLLASS